MYIYISKSRCAYTGGAKRVYTRDLYSSYVTGIY